ncbi:hypothetical protein BG006_001119 [Podila minutissima]|uniref:LysM domain-containing protein n=1 Tax=Podila minutissima TaxID=64525 RepID=A0A9P5SAL8_9FUNG|nr:hypothetical protein BG006_001119 [Podila minutissima]
MKFTLSAVVLALAATQVQAIVPTPVKGCTQLVMITPADTSCVDFAAKFGITFEQLRALNLRLDAICANLDVGHPICVSNTGPNLGTLTSTPPYPSQTALPTTTGPVPVPTTTSGAVVPPVNGTTSAAAPTATSSAAAGTPKPSAPASAASSSKASFVLGAAGVLLSVAYML